MKKLSMVAVVAAISALSACAVQPQSSNSVYRSGQTQNEQTVRLGVVESVREVIIDGGQSGVGTVGGAAVGGIAAASTIGGGNGSAVAGVLGAIAGGLIGNKLESDATHRKGLEITVRLDNGELKAITQDADEAFRAGERVRLLSTGRTTRVTH